WRRRAAARPGRFSTSCEPDPRTRPPLSPRPGCSARSGRSTTRSTCSYGQKRSTRASCVTPDCPASIPFVRIRDSGRCWEGSGCRANRAPARCSLFGNLMTLSAGARLGPYEILAPLGAGGMGEVYRARDTRLERTVAVKVLPSHLSSSPEVRQRFEREARTISQLSHPHICALYDVGREGETEYLVIEYIEGKTLTDRLAKGPLPLDQALRCGIQIADALDRAHRQGIVHRDLKPGNVMLTKSGVKLLDFGLAKVMSPSTRPASVTSLPTAMGGSDLTREGTILGTYQYMAPEQLEGKEADARSDIFAFGAVLYEMVTGQKAFTGRSQASLIAAILEHEPPPISALQPMTPPALDRV